MSISAKRSKELGMEKRQHFEKNGMKFVTDNVSDTMIQRYWSWERIYITVARFKAKKRKGTKTTTLYN